MNNLDRRNLYHVEVFDENKEKVDEQKNVRGWTRREAYCDVMNQLKPHKTWDATIIKDNNEE